MAETETDSVAPRLKALIDHVVPHPNHFELICQEHTCLRLAIATIFAHKGAGWVPYVP